MSALTDCPADLELNGLVFSIYQVRGQWKVAHCVRVNGRVGKGMVRNVATRRDGAKYAQQYAAAN